MTRKPRSPRGRLGQWLLAAFVLVAFVSVGLITVAALVGTDRGLATVARADQQRAAHRTAQSLADAYARSGDWPDADLVEVQAATEGAQLFVRDADGTIVWPRQGSGPGGRGSGSHSNGGSMATAAIEVGGVRVGEVWLVFHTVIDSERTVAWSWVVRAAAVALAAALLVSWYVSRRLTAPLLSLARTARTFARGDRSARSGIRPRGELGDLARAFDSMADDVVRAESVRRQLAADVAHELRTPLAALQAGLEELRDGLCEPDPSRLGSLHDQALRLGRVVDDLAELSAAEAAAPSLRASDVDLAAVSAAALDAQEPRLRAAGLVISRDIRGPVRIVGDADRLNQAVSNLLANAGRYCRPGDTVTLRVAIRDGQAVAQVADTGPGIADRDLPHIFERLWRGPGSHAVAGSGIGLAVVRELVTAHGGSVGAESVLGQGSVFTIRLPLARRVNSQFSSRH